MFKCLVVLTACVFISDFPARCERCGCGQAVSSLFDCMRDDEHSLCTCDSILSSFWLFSVLFHVCITICWGVDQARQFSFVLCRFMDTHFVRVLASMDADCL